MSQAKLAGSLSCMARQMRIEKIIPEVIKFAPKTTLHVSYDTTFKVGDVLTPTAVKCVPRDITWPTQDPKRLYALALVDPDAPSRKTPTFREWQHWIVINMPGNCIPMAHTIVEYIGSAPPKDTGLHRYIFLVFRQKHEVDPEEERRLCSHTAEGRGKFSICKFQQKHNFEDIPEAGTYFRAAYDHSVDETYKRLAAGEAADKKRRQKAGKK